MLQRGIPRVASRVRRLSSTPASNDAALSSSSHAPSPPSAIAASADAPPSSSLPPWLHRILRHWDRESGTHEILRLKRQVESSSASFDATQRQVAAARTKLDQALEAFEEGQVRHNQLLQSRERWTPSQAMEFAKLLEREVTIRKEWEGAKKEVAALESAQLRHMHAYMNDLRRRYQEEQLWQDRWRIYSTFGTWGLIVLNSMVFLISQYMYRVREARRNEDVRGLLTQSLAVQEGALRAVQEGKEQSEQEGRLETENAAPHLEKPVRSEDKPAVEDASDAPIEGSHATEGSQAGPDAASSDSSREGTPLPVYWERIRQYAQRAKERIPPAMKRIDVPSAVLGAAATGVAWLVAAAVSSSGKGA